MKAQEIINNAIAAKLPIAEIYKVASELRKRGIFVEVRIPGQSQNRNNICSYGGNSGGGRLGAIAKSIYGRGQMV